MQNRRQIWLWREIRSRNAASLIRLVDGSGGGGSVKTLEMVGYSYVPALQGFSTTMELMGQVPVVCACMGSVAGLGAVRVTISHFH